LARNAASSPSSSPDESVPADSGAGDFVRTTISIQSGSAHRSLDTMVAALFER
jgi:hypothetical protein